MCVRKLLFVTLTVCIYESNTEPVSFITKCKSSDSTCLKKSSQAAIPAFVAGLPEFKVEPLDPLYVGKVDGSTSDLKFINTDGTVTGLKDCIIENVELNAAHTNLNITILCDVTFKSRYEIAGRILIVPFNGKGNLIGVLRKFRYNMQITLGKKFDKEGRNHLTVKNYKYTYEMNGKSELEMTNLFDGNEVLSRAAHQLISTNSNEVIIEIGPPIIKAIVERIVKVLSQFLRAVPEEDLLLD